jgi:AraC-like DNA-binding protein
MLVGPMLFFYIRGVLEDDYRLKKIDLLHFIPAVLYTINILKHLFSSWEYKLLYADTILVDPINLIKFDYVFFPGELSFMFRPIIGLVYIIVCIVMVARHYAKYKSDDAQFNLIRKWLITLLFFISVIFVTFFMFSVLGLLFQNYQSAATNGVIILTISLISLFALNTLLLFFPGILYGFPQFDYVVSNHVDPLLDNELKVSSNAKKINRGFEISEEKLLLLKYKIDKYCELKPYLNLDFNLSVMSAETDIPVHHLSYFFNEYLKLNFNTWKNDLKIDHVIQLIHNGSSEILTLDALAKQAGFGSRTTFFNAFKQKMGQTPSEYLNTID